MQDLTKDSTSTFAIRVNLPTRQFSTVMFCSSTFTVQEVLQTSIKKLYTILGVEVSDSLFTLVDDLSLTEYHSNEKMINLDCVQQALKDQSIPSFLLKLNPSSHKSSIEQTKILSNLQQVEQSSADETNQQSVISSKGANHALFNQPNSDASFSSPSLIEENLFTAVRRKTFANERNSFNTKSKMQPSSLSESVEINELFPEINHPPITKVSPILNTSDQISARRSRANTSKLSSSFMSDYTLVTKKNSASISLPSSKLPSPEADKSHYNVNMSQPTSPTHSIRKRLASNANISPSLSTNLTHLDINDEPTNVKKVPFNVIVNSRRALRRHQSSPTYEKPSDNNASHFSHLVNSKSKERLPDFSIDVVSGPWDRGQALEHIQDILPSYLTQSLSPTDSDHNTFSITFFSMHKKASPMTLDVSGNDTIQRIKTAIWCHHDFPDCTEDMDKYRIKYLNSKDQWVELFDEQQMFQNISDLNKWIKEEKKIEFWIDLKQTTLSKQAQLLNKKIGSLIGYGLYRFEYMNDPEVDIFRRNMVQVRQHAVEHVDHFLHAANPNVDTSPPSMTMLQKIGDFERLQLRIHLTNPIMVKTMACQMQDFPKTVLTHFLLKCKLVLPDTYSQPEKYCLKICGAADYLVGSFRMIDFVAIRKLIMREERINLLLVSIDNIILSDTPMTEDFDFIENAAKSQGSHKQLTIQGKNPEKISFISLWDVTRKCRVQMVSSEALTTGDVESVYVEAGLYHGNKLLCPLLKSDQVSADMFQYFFNIRVAAPSWNCWLEFDIQLFHLPRNAKLCMTVWGRWSAKKKIELDKESDIYPLGCINTMMIDYKGLLKAGVVKLTLWPNEKANPIEICVNNCSFQDPALYIKFETFSHPVIFPAECEKSISAFNSNKNEANLPASNSSESPKIPGSPVDLTSILAKDELTHLESAIQSDPLTKLTDGQTELIWKHSTHLTHREEALPKVLQSARWNKLDDVLEVQRLMYLWAPMSPEAALELLDSNYGDSGVRAYAVGRLEILEDDRLMDYLLQLVQVLKYEPYLDNALCRFLLRRALQSQSVGHRFFWYLRAEVESPECSVRFALLLEAYLRGCSRTEMDELVKECDVLSRLFDVAEAIKKVKSSSDKRETLHLELEKMSLPTSFRIATNPRINAKAFIKSKCKYMDSKKLPLWCVFQNVDTTGKDIYLIFKTGDDLRQDMLTLQMITIMDRLWQARNLDLRMKPYGCISMGKDLGMIEVVLNAETVSNIQVAYGGSTAAFKDQPLDEWLRRRNPHDRDYQNAVDTFTLSCAGYCVATYVLGIGDRHNDNIMVTRDGHLFHIDFGHFLGNIKRKFGIKRERAPFVLTPDFVYVMGKRDSPQFEQFINYCITAFLILRQHANMFITLFAMMLSTGIPELKTAEDIQYLRTALCLGVSEDVAADHMRNLIFESLRLGWSTQLNWMVHNFAH